MIFSKKYLIPITTLICLIIAIKVGYGQNAKTIDSLKTIISKSKNDTLRISAHISLADEYYSVNRLDSALSTLDAALSVCEIAIEQQKSGNKNLLIQKAKILISKAAINKKLGNPIISLEILEESQRLSDSIGYQYGIAWSIYHAGDCYDYIGDLNKSLELYNKSLLIFRETGDRAGVGKALNSIGVIYDYQGELETAMDYYTQAMVVYQEIGDMRGIADQYNNFGVIYYLTGDYLKALENYNMSADINKNIVSNRSIYAVTLNNIGLIYDNFGDLLTALEYYNQSLKIFESLDFGSGIVMPLNNLGDSYSKQGDFDKALEYYLRSLDVCEKTNDEQGRAYTLEKICTLYTNEKKFDHGENYCKKCLETYKKIGDKHGIASSLVAMGRLMEQMSNYAKAIEYFRKGLDVYLEIGDKQAISKIYFYMGSIAYVGKEYDKAFDYAIKAYNLAKEVHYASEISLAANLLNKIYRTRGDYQKALQYYEEHINITKTPENEKVQRMLQEQYYRLQYEKRATADSIAYSQAMAIKNLELEKKKEQTRRQRWVIYSVVIGLFVFLVFSVALLRLLISKRIAYKQLSQSHLEINQQKEEITTQRDEIENQKNLLQEKNAMLESANAEISAQRDMVTEQKERIEEVNLHLTDSLRYAQSIQAAIVPSEKVLQNISANYFVLMKPCELVSGDFFWATSFDDFHIFCVVDCTGHGVPGAFMSILGITALNDIVSRHRVTEPGKILDFMRESVLEALGHNDQSQLHKDGMDMSLCVLNRETRELKFAGAGLPLWVVIDKSQSSIIINPNETVVTTSDSNLSLIEIKGDIMPVGKSPQQKPFTSKSLFLPSENVGIYLATDGFSDQFNQHKTTKFGVTRLKKLLLHNFDKPFADQKGALEMEFEKWKGNTYQIDDVTILGISV